MTSIRRFALLVTVILLAAVRPGPITHAAEAPFALDGGGLVSTGDLVVTTFATGLPFPVGMSELPDGSLLVAISQPDTDFYTSSGALLRLTDENHDGVADDAGKILTDNLPGAQVDLRRVGNLIYVVSVAPLQPAITVLRLGENPADPLETVGTITISANPPLLHGTFALAIDPTPRQPNHHILYFNVGSAGNLDHGRTATFAGLLNAELPDASLYRVRVTMEHGEPVFGRPQHIATGLRNAAGIALDPANGDLWFEDNGIDGLVEPIMALSADELNLIPAAAIGGEVEDFGFPETYIDAVTGQKVGGTGMDPVVAFTPLDGSESEGAAGIAFAPPAFPEEYQGGLFVGFHGQWNGTGLNNEENPLVFYSPTEDRYIHIVSNDEPAIGHLDGLCATADALYLSDITGAEGSMATSSTTGAIYRIAVKS